MYHSIDYTSEQSTPAFRSVWITNHADKRMQKRGISKKDLDCLMKYGSQTRNGYLITKKDAQLLTQHLKQEISRIERLASKQTLVIVKGNTLVTTFPATHTQLKREFNN
jgi:hypothetical protein